MNDPVRILQKGFQATWDVNIIPQVFFGSSADTVPPDIVDYCLIDCGEASRSVVSNISRIWDLPVRIRLFGVSCEDLEVRVGRLLDYIGVQESVSTSRLALSIGHVMSVAVEDIEYSEIEATRWQAAISVAFKVVLPR